MSRNVSQRGREGTLTTILIFCEWNQLAALGQDYFLHSIAERHPVGGEHIMMDILLSCSVWKS